MSNEHTKVETNVVPAAASSERVPVSSVEHAKISAPAPSGGLLWNPKFAWACVFIWMCIIFAFSAQAHSGEITAEYFGDYNFSVRKCAHMTEYGILFFLSRRALLLTPPKFYGTSGLWPLFLCFLYAMSDEFHQLFVPGRSAQFNDVLIDTTGATICWLIFVSLNIIKNKLKTYK